jgi:hypothetical protein
MGALPLRIFPHAERTAWAEKREFASVEAIVFFDAGLPGEDAFAARLDGLSSGAKPRLRRRSSLTPSLSHNLPQFGEIFFTKFHGGARAGFVARLLGATGSGQGTRAHSTTSGCSTSALSSSKGLMR